MHFTWFCRRDEDFHISWKTMWNAYSPMLHHLFCPNKPICKNNKPTAAAILNNNNNFTGIGIVVNVAGCLIRGRRRWSVTYTSPQGLHVRISEFFRIWNWRVFQERKPYQLPGRMKNSPYYAPAGARTHLFISLATQRSMRECLI